MDQDAHMRRIIDNLSSDLNNLSSETKRKFAPVKEACEGCLLKLRQINSLKTNLYKTMCESSADVIKPLILGCETKQPKIIQICLTSVQKVIEAKILNTNSAMSLINTLWLLTDSSLEELKVLQTIILLVSTTDVVKHQLLAKTLSIGLRIASSKDQVLMNTATAQLSQMVTKVFERVLVESKHQQANSTASNANKQIDIDHLKTLSREAPYWMNESAQDAYMLLQDIYLLLNSDQSLWFININEINKPFGLELLKSILIRYPEIFYNNPEMCFILKERICPLLIKLFSPSTKLKLSSTTSSPTSSSIASVLSSATSGSSAMAQQQNLNDQKNFSIVSRLIRIVFVLIKNYFELLITESEIFLSLLTKFLEVDRPLWQKALAIEVFHKISVETRLIQQIVLNYDMKQHPEKIFYLIANGIALFIQSLFLHAATSSGGSSSSSSSSSSGVVTASSLASSILSQAQSSQSQSGSSTSPQSSAQSSQQSSSSSASSSGASSNNFAFQISSAQPSFVYKDTTIQLLFPYISGQMKSVYLDGWDKMEIPYIQDGYLLSIGFSTLQELSKSVQTLIEQNIGLFNQHKNDDSTSSAQQTSASSPQQPQQANFVSFKRLNITNEQMSTSPQLLESVQIMNSCCNSFLFVYNILLESSLDETITEQIIKSIRSFIYMCSLLNMNLQRDAFVTCMCKAALPSSYAHNVLNLKSIADLNYLLQQSNGHAPQHQQQPAPVYNNANKSGNKTHPMYDDSSDRQIQVVAIGPALHLSGGVGAGSTPQSTLYITAKNLLTMKAILNMSHMYCELLGSAWYIVLNTLQHLTWTLGLKPTVGSNGQLKHLSSLLPSSSGAGGSSSSSSAASASSSSAGGTSSLGAANQSGGSEPGGAMITTAIQTEVAFICNLLTKLFESTRAISDQALVEIIDSLIKLSIECADLAYMRNEPCLFAIAKLYETTISNLNRIDLFWQKVTMHLLCACKHTNVKYREWCVDSICNMIRSTFNYKYSIASSTAQNPSADQNWKSVNENTQAVRDSVLQPLCELSTINFNDVRQKQIECTLSILRLMGQHLNESWPLCLNIIGAIQKEHTDILIRSAFQCLQLVVTDFLSMIKANYLNLVINVVAKFGSQEQDLNISLTAIVLLWNISDYMFQNSENLNQELKGGKSGAGAGDAAEAITIESVWMVLYSRLGQLCVDSRPAVRKSACQTLFCTISSHGPVLSADLYWKDLVWHVLFPLLEQVRHFTNTASREKDKHANHPNFLMHHSRDTAEKQWAETTVLTLSGVTRVFNSKCSILMKLDDGEFHRMWLFLLNIIKTLALSRNAEICLAALRGFHELLGNQNYFSSQSSVAGLSNSAAQTVAAAASAASVINSSTNSAAANSSNGPNSRKKLDQNGSESSTINNSPTSNATTTTSTGTANTTTVINKSFDINEWLAAWKTWLDIGNTLVNMSSSSSSSNDSSPVAGYTWPPPTQTFLTCYVDLVSVIVDKLAPVAKFTQKDFDNFSQILDKLLSIPVLSNDYSSFILLQIDSNLTPLQNTSLNTVKNFIKLFKVVDPSFQNQFISLVFQRLLSFVLYACYTNNPNLTNYQMTNGVNGHEASSSGKGQSMMMSKANEIVSVNFVPFGEKALQIVTSLYEENANHESVIENNILKSVIQTLYVPLSLKYSCPNASTWKLSIECLFKILKKALPIAQKNKTAFETIWIDLARTFEDFLFSKNISTSELPLETIQNDEMIDCQVIELIRDDILTHSSLMPQQFIQKILAILNRGSIYSNTFDNFLELESTRKMREEFSKTCFETLLRFSFINESSNAGHVNGTANNNANDTNLNKMALASMLNRCKDIIQKYAHDEKLSGSVPLPRARSNEMISVLKALGTLISALKKAPKDTIPATIWNQVIGLYPCLVECTTSPSPQISNCIKDTLHHYFSLLKAP